jgi:hypothetical protein
MTTFLLTKCLFNFPTGSTSTLIKAFSKITGKILIFAIVVFVLWFLLYSLIFAQCPPPPPPTETWDFLYHLDYFPAIKLKTVLKKIRGLDIFFGFNWTKKYDWTLETVFGLKQRWVKYIFLIMKFANPPIYGLTKVWNENVFFIFWTSKFSVFWGILTKYNLCKNCLYI